MEQFITMKCNRFLKGSIALNLLNKIHLIQNGKGVEHDVFSNK